MKYLFYLCLFSVIFGPLGGFSLQIPGVNLYLTDIFVGLLCIIWLRKISKIWMLKGVQHDVDKDKISLFFLLFFLSLLLSFIFSPLSLTFQERLISGLYLLRYLAYFFVYIFALFLVKTKEISKKDILQTLGIIGVFLAVLGWVQYFLYPDLRNLSYLGWDPHYKRIFATYFDPNYFGLMMVLALSVLSNNIFLSKISVWLARVFIFITLMFTYSRSSFLSFIIASIYYCLRKRKTELLFFCFFVFLFFTLILPRSKGEGVKLERFFSMEKRIENWQEGLKLFLKHPILGIGFNTIRYAKIKYKISSQEDLITSHAGAGFDNSFIFVAATSGIVGLFFFILFLVNLYKNIGLMGKISLIAVVVHSLFLNSLFFPWIILWLWALVGVSRRSKAKKSNDLNHRLNYID